MIGGSFSKDVSITNHHGRAIVTTSNKLSRLSALIRIRAFQWVRHAGGQGVQTSVNLVSLRTALSHTAQGWVMLSLIRYNLPPVVNQHRQGKHGSWICPVTQSSSQQSKCIIEWFKSFQASKEFPQKGCGTTAAVCMQLCSSDGGCHGAIRRGNRL